MTLENKFSLTTNPVTGEVKIEVISNGHTIEDVVAGLIKGLIKGGAMKL